MLTRSIEYARLDRIVGLLAADELCAPGARQLTWASLPHVFYP